MFPQAVLAQAHSDLSGVNRILEIIEYVAVALEIEQRWPWQRVNHSLAEKAPESNDPIAERPEA